MVVVNISQDIYMSKHHIVYLKYKLLLFVNYTSVKLKKINNKIE